MALVVETGAGLANAESFASVAFADAYFAKRGDTRFDQWDAADDKEAMLRAATDYMEQEYRLWWSGTRNTDEQALSWPRYNARSSDKWNFYTNDVVPDEVMRACCELAIRAIATPLVEDLGREVASESVAGAVSVTYRLGSSRQTTYEAVLQMLRPLFSGSATGRSTGSVSRA